MGSRSWSRSSAVSPPQVTEAINPALGCHYFPPGPRLPPQHHRPLAGTKLYCLVTEAHVCKQLAQVALGSAAAGIRTATCWSQVRLPNHRRPSLVYLTASRLTWVNQYQQHIIRIQLSASLSLPLSLQFPLIIFLHLIRSIASLGFKWKSFTASSTTPFQVMPRQ